MLFGDQYSQLPSVKENKIAQNNVFRRNNDKEIKNPKA